MPAKILFPSDTKCGCTAFLWATPHNSTSRRYPSAFQLYVSHTIGAGCWVGYCSDFDECPNGGEIPWHSDNIDHFIGWAYAGIPALLMLITVVTCNTMIYRIARKTLRWSFNSGHMQDAQKKRLRAIAVQINFYVGCFCITFMWSFWIRVLSSASLAASDAHKLFPLLILEHRVLVGITNGLDYFADNNRRIHIIKRHNSFVRITVRIAALSDATTVTVLW